MSYRITVGHDAEWAERCVPRDMPYSEAVWTAMGEGATVIASDRRTAGRFVRVARKLGVSRGELLDTCRLVVFGASR